MGAEVEDRLGGGERKTTRGQHWHLGPGPVRSGGARLQRADAVGGFPAVTMVGMSSAVPSRSRSPAAPTTALSANGRPITVGSVGEGRRPPRRHPVRGDVLQECRLSRRARPVNRLYIPDLSWATCSMARIDPGPVLDFETDLGGIADAYAAMDLRRAIKSLVRIGSVRWASLADAADVRRRP